MRVVLALPAIVLASGLMARGQDLLPATGETTVYHTHHLSAGAAPQAAASHWHAMPHYHGRGEWPGPCPCCQAPDGTVWGTCARPRSYVMHLWDDYCCEKTKCPCCGHALGSWMHWVKCERNRCHCAVPACGCPRPCPCSCGCAGGGESILYPSQDRGDAPGKGPTASDDAPRPPKPMDDMDDMMPPKMKDDMGEKKKPMPKAKAEKKKAKKDMPEKKEKVEPKSDTSFNEDKPTSALDSLPAFLAPLINGSK